MGGGGIDLLGDVFGSSAPIQPAAPINSGFNLMAAAAPAKPYNPQPISTPEFGGAWGTLPLEKSAIVNVAGCTTTEGYKQLVQTRLGFHVVEVINNEVISAALDPTQGNIQVLLHCRVEGSGQLTFTVKSSAPGTLNDLSSRHLPALAQPAAGGGQPAT